MRNRAGSVLLNGGLLTNQIAISSALFSRRLSAASTRCHLGAIVLADSIAADTGAQLHPRAERWLRLRTEAGAGQLRRNLPLGQEYRGGGECPSRPQRLACQRRIKTCWIPQRPGDTGTALCAASILPAALGFGRRLAPMQASGRCQHVAVNSGARRVGRLARRVRYFGRLGQWRDQAGASVAVAGTGETLSNSRGDTPETRTQQRRSYADEQAEK